LRFQQAIREHDRHYIIDNPLVGGSHRDNKQMKTIRMKTGSGGFTLVEIMIVVAIIGLLCAIVIPNYIKARANAQSNACINNMREMSNAADQFALEHGKTTGYHFVYPDDITAYLKLTSSGEVPPCPAGGTYDLQLVGSIPQAICSLADTVTPAHMLQ
jgi:prepilin-type N-terminal cleavage/methylation domain-containing protein